MLMSKLSSDKDNIKSSDRGEVVNKGSLMPCWQIRILDDKESFKTFCSK